MITRLKIFGRSKVLLALGCFKMATLLTESIVQWKEKSFCFLKFKGKPTEGAKTEDDQTTYNGFVILNKSERSTRPFVPARVEVHDSCCRHVTAVLFDVYMYFKEM